MATPCKVNINVGGKTLTFDNSSELKAYLAEGGLDDLVDSGALSEDYRQKAKEGGTPPTEPPPPVTEKTGSEDEFRDKAIINRLIKSEKVSEDVKERLRESGLKYKVRHQADARNIANGVLDEYGMNAAMVMAESGKFHGDVNSMIFALSLDRTFQEEQEVVGTEEKQKAAEKYADIALRYQDAAESGGRFISAINDFYQKSPAGLVIKTEKEFKRREDEYFEKREKSTKEAWMEFVNTVEGKELLEEEIEKRKPKLFTDDTKKKIKGFFDKFRSDPKNPNAGVYLLPPQILNAAIDIIEQAVLAGVSIAKAIEQGVDYINNNHKETWKADEFRKDIKNGFKAQKIQRNLSEQEKQRIIDKWKSKLRGLNETQRQSLLNKAFFEFMDKGTMSYEDFKKLYGQEVGLPQMTPEMATKISDLAKAINEPGKLKEQIQKTKDPKLIKQYAKALEASEKASTELNDLIGKQKWWVDTLFSVMRLNTLGTVSLIGNIVGNVATLPVRFMSNLTKTGMDYMLSGVQQMSNKVFGTKFEKKAPYNVFKIQGGYARGLALGTAQAIKQFITGLTNKDYFQKEVQQNLQPLRSAKKLYNGITGKQKISLNEALNSFIEAFPTGGMSAELVARSLNVGDKGFRYAAEYAKATQLADQKGLKGIDREIFTLFPDEESEKQIKAAGEKAVFQQKNLITDMVNKAGTAITGAIKKKEGIKGKAVRGLYAVGRGSLLSTQPFLNTPINVGWEFMHYAFPPIALVQAGIAMYEKDADKATYHLSQAVVGIAMGWAVAQLAAAGLILPSGGSDEPEKERKGIQAFQREGQLNITGTKRWLAGGKPENRDNDVYIDLRYYGFTGMLMLAKARQYQDMSKKDIEQLSYAQDLVGQFIPSIQVGLTEGVFSSTGTAMNAISMGGGYTDQWLMGMMNVGVNTFDPNWLRSFSLASNDYYRDPKGMTLPETAKNQLKQRFFMAEDLPKKINIWGDKVESVPNQTNPYLYYFFGLNKATLFDNDKFGFALYDYYLKTKDYNIFPPAIKREVNNKALTPEQYEQFQILVGSHRKQLISALVDGGAFESLKSAGHEETIKYLQALYNDAREIAVEEFVGLHPEFQKQESSIY